MGFDRDALIGALDHHDACNRDVTEADDPDMGWCYRMRERQADRILALMSNADVMAGWRKEWGDDADYHAPKHEHDFRHFDRTLCGECDAMHYYCECGTPEPCATIAAEPELDARCSEGMLITEHTREAAPSQGIDRDALLVLLAEFGYDGAPDRAKLADAILALVRPVEGVTLTPEEKATVIDALRDISDMDERMAQIRPSRQREIDERRALAARLEKEIQ